MSFFNKPWAMPPSIKEAVGKDLITISLVPKAKWIIQRLPNAITWAIW